MWRKGGEEAQGQREGGAWANEAEEEERGTRLAIRRKREEREAKGTAGRGVWGGVWGACCGIVGG